MKYSCSAKIQELNKKSWLKCKKGIKGAADIADDIDKVKDWTSMKLN